MKFNEINDFVVQHENAEHFEKDRDLFVKIFPNSRIIPSLFRANQFEKKKLDGRMLLELLNYVTPEAILLNRKGADAPAGDAGEGEAAGAGADAPAGDAGDVDAAGSEAPVVDSPAGDVDAAGTGAPAVDVPTKLDAAPAGKNKPTAKKKGKGKNTQA